MSAGPPGPEQSAGGSRGAGRSGGGLPARRPRERAAARAGWKARMQASAEGGASTVWRGISIERQRASLGRGEKTSSFCVGLHSTMNLRVSRDGHDGRDRRGTKSFLTVASAGFLGRTAVRARTIVLGSALFWRGSCLCGAWGASGGRGCGVSATRARVGRVPLALRVQWSTAGTSTARRRSVRHAGHFAHGWHGCDVRGALTKRARPSCEPRENHPRRGLRAMDQRRPRGALDTRAGGSQSSHGHGVCGALGTIPRPGREPLQ